MPFDLPLLPPEVDISPLLPLIVSARDAIARFDESVRHLPNPGIIRRSFETKEAVASSAIEGTQVTVEDVFEMDASGGVVEPENKTKLDYQEVTNYRRAIDLGQEILQTRPLAENEIKRLHRELLSSGRGQHRFPGEFRNFQVHIGRPGSNLEEASYIPPAATDIPRLFSNLVNYMHSNECADRLVQAGIIHYQFEAIHPFADGNGRTGRMIIPLYLYEYNLTRFPNLYISEFFENHRQDYYAALLQVSTNGDWISWLDFFLHAVREQAKISLRRVRRIEELYERIFAQLPEYNSSYAANFLHAIFSQPIFTATSISKAADIENNRTVNLLIDKFIKHGVVRDITPDKTRSKKYAAQELLNIINYPELDEKAASQG